MPTDFMNIPMLSPTEVKAQLSDKFKKFIQKVQSGKVDVSFEEEEKNDYIYE